jgi:hypothetical protein
MQIDRSVPAKGFDLLRLEQKGVILIRECLYGLGQFLQSVFCQSRMTPSAGLV